MLLLVISNLWWSASELGAKDDLSWLAYTTSPQLPCQKGQNTLWNQFNSSSESADLSNLFLMKIVSIKLFSINYINPTTTLLSNEYSRALTILIAFVNIIYFGVRVNYEAAHKLILAVLINLFYGLKYSTWVQWIIQTSGVWAIKILLCPKWLMIKFSG